MFRIGQTALDNEQTNHAMQQLLAERHKTIDKGMENEEILRLMQGLKSQVQEDIQAMKHDY